MTDFLGTFLKNVGCFLIPVAVAQQPRSFERGIGDVLITCRKSGSQQHP